MQMPLTQPLPAGVVPASHCLSIVLSGSGGAGVMTAGGLLLEAAAGAGLYGLMVRTSGPQIRGGEAAALLRFSADPIENMGDRFDYLIAMDWLNLQRFSDEIPLDAASRVVGDPDEGEMPEAFARMGAHYSPVSFKALSKAIAGSWPNMVALGYAGSLLGLPEEAVQAVVRRQLGRSKTPIQASLDALAAGARAASDLGDQRLAVPRPRADRQARWLLTGNEAAGYGAIRGGVRFVAAYPITPATELLEWMAPALEKVGGVLVQAEDELASINMALGASYGGVPSLTATAGPGLSLMTEALGLAVAAELPVVVVDVMRGGPSTGIPAKSEQSDISIATQGLHGDAPRLVIVPNSIEDCLLSTQWAVHLAETLQAPAIVLSDQFFGQTRAVVDRPPELHLDSARLVPVMQGDDTPRQPYRRYADTASGVSPMALPGMAGGMYTADGLEHNERGTPSSQAADHRRQLDKRQRKLDLAPYGSRWADQEGEGDWMVITLGSATGPVREALRRLADDGLAVRLLSIRLLAPARVADFAAATSGVRRVLVVEQNHSAQFHRYLRSVYDLPGEVRSYCQPGPLPIRPGQIHQTLMQWSRA